MAENISKEDVLDDRGINRMNRSEDRSNQSAFGDENDILDNADDKLEVKSKKKISIRKLIFGISLSLLCILSLVLLIGWKVVLTLKLSELKSSKEALQSPLNDTIKRAYSLIRYSENRRSTFKNFRSSVEVLRAKLNKLQVDIEDLSEVTHVAPGYPNLHSSCEDILKSDPFSSSGYYFTKSESGQLRSVYCRMERCGTDDKPWTRVAYLNLDNCPPGTKAKVFHGKKTCLVERDKEYLNGNCTEIVYPISQKDSYSKICGKIQGYSVGTLDGIVFKSVTDVNRFYVDGVSVVTGNTHVWTLVAGKCLANKIPQFVGTHWGCTDVGICHKIGKFCHEHILWVNPRHDSNRQWFNRESLQGASNITVRVCRDQNPDDEDIALKEIELYIK